MVRQWSWKLLQDRHLETEAKIKTKTKTAKIGLDSRAVSRPRPRSRGLQSTRLMNCPSSDLKSPLSRHISVICHNTGQKTVRYSLAINGFVQRLKHHHIVYTSSRLIPAVQRGASASRQMVSLSVSSAGLEKSKNVEFLKKFLGFRF